ncbi:MAG: TRAP transporter large permease subunit, partial [Planctomycetota bacterium]|nr:TRAP transporter large permease subunit [Planctomycetota bacterium]
MSGIPIAILVGGMLFLMLTGLPLAFSIFAVSTLVMMAYTRLPLWQIMQRFFAGVDSFVLTAIPFFLLAGNLMNSGKITDKLIRLSSTMVGHIRGGLAHINVLVSLLFGGI